MGVADSEDRPIATAQLLEVCIKRDARITSRTLELWRSQDLLPRPARTGQAGLRPEWTYPVGTLNQLSALLDLRATTTNPNVLRVALWYAGYPVPPSRVQTSILAVLRSLRTEFDKELSRRHASADMDDTARSAAIDAVAARVAGRRAGGLPRLGRQQKQERSQAVAAVLRVFFSEADVAVDPPADGMAVERLLGVDRGRRFKIDGVGPWLTGPANDTLNGFTRIGSVAALIAAVETATDEDLEAARQSARALVHGLAAFTTLVDAMYGQDNVSGMKWASFVAGDPYAPLLMTSFCVSAARSSELAPGLTAMLQAITDSILPLSRLNEELLEAVQAPNSVVPDNIGKLSFKEQGQIRRVLGLLSEKAVPQP